MSKTLDEKGVEWEVRSKDPAIKLVRQLEKSNFSLIILPRTCYLAGTVVQWKAPSNEKDINQVRLADCLQALNG